MKSRKTRSGVVVAMCGALSLAAAALADMPEIRFASQAPFKDGKRVDAVWKSADTLTRFVIPKSLDVATYETEAQLLFDDRNLYATFKGFVDPKTPVLDKPAHGIEGSNNFELFLQGDPSKLSYLHVIVDEFARIHTDINKASQKVPGILASVERGKGYWRCNVTIPLDRIPLAAPAESAEIRLGLMRQNVDMPDTVKYICYSGREMSSYVPLEKLTYGDPSKFTAARLTRSAGEPRRRTAPDGGLRVNLMRNPDFAAGTVGWSYDSGVERCETMYLSNDWVMRGDGKVYRVVSGVPAEWEAGEEYTLVVRARSFGGACAMRIVENVWRDDGTRGEGTYPTMKTPVGPDFHVYYYTFRTTPGQKPMRLNFYKVGESKAGLGIDYASIRMYKGRVSSFEIREYSRPGRKSPVAGTEPKLRDSSYGKAARRPRVFALAGSITHWLEIEDIFRGTGIACDAVATSGNNQDIYTVQGKAAEVTARLEKGEYDVYLVGANLPQRMGQELAKIIAGNVEKGAGLYLEKSKSYGHLSSLEAKSKGGVFGKGRVNRVSRSSGYGNYRADMPNDRFGIDEFPFYDIEHAEIVEGVMRTAFGDPAVSDGARKRAETILYGGERHTLEWTLDAEGRTVSFVRRVEKLSGPKLGAFSDDGRAVSVGVEGDAAGLRLRWSFCDFSGRVLAEGECAAEGCAIRVPREKLFTNMGLVRFELCRGQETVDRRTEAIWERANDIRRVYDDFVAAIWPVNHVFPLNELAVVNRQMEDVGISAQIMPTGGRFVPAGVMRTGMACGGGFVGHARTFCRGTADEKNIRSPQFNSAESRKFLAKYARENAARSKAYGVIEAAICDEPQMNPYGKAAEIDEHPENVAEYRTRMQAKYGTIAEFNRRHQSSYASFAEITPAHLKDAHEGGRMAEFVEWRNFNVDRWVEVLRLVIDSAHDVDPDLRVSPYEMWGETAFSGNDYWKMLTKAGFGVSNDYLGGPQGGRPPLRQFDEFYRSFRPDMRVWSFAGYFYSSELMKFMPWWCMAHRYGGFTWYNATSDDYRIIAEPSLALVIDAKELKESLAESKALTGLGKLMSCWQWAKRDVALYYSHDSSIVSTVLGKETKDMEMRADGPFHDFLTSRVGVQYLVEDLLYQHDFVSYAQVAEGKLVKDGYKILFMPRIISMSDAEVAAVKTFLAKGGTVVADELPGAYDELGVKRAAPPFTASEVVVYGRNFASTSAEQRRRTLELLERAGATKAVASPTILDHYGREAMHFVSGAADVYPIIRMPGRSKDDDAEEFVFAKKGFVYEAPKGAFLGETDRVKVTVPRNGGVALAVLPAKIDAIAIDGLPPVMERGGDLSLDFAVVSAGPAADSPRYALHVEIVPPSGTVRIHFKRNLLTEGGRAHLDFPVALNDEPGQWKVVVSEPLTGVRAEKSFALK